VIIFWRAFSDVDPRVSWSWIESFRFPRQI